ncbi:hypothetical protein [Streptomyces sp. NPDC047869]|uniref:hypothetical protein n=1 Tax=Streptomyces sp. NPDC047869 TaxID=3154709 RepID=UPI0034514691
MVATHPAIDWEHLRGVEKGRRLPTGIAAPGTGTRLSLRAPVQRYASALPPAGAPAVPEGRQGAPLLFLAGALPGKDVTVDVWVDGGED